MNYEHFMEKALGEARTALAAGEFPVGCIMVHDTKIVASGARKAQLADLGEEKAKDLPEPKKTIRETWTYFLNGQERMHYDQYRQRGLFIGSGTVESACNWLIGTRLKQSNMRWSKQGAHYVMQVRALFFSDRNRWELFWANRRPPPRHRHLRAKAA